MSIQTGNHDETHRRWTPESGRLAASGGSEFGDYLSKRGDEVAESLLSLTDSLAEASERPIIVKTYRAVRGNAGKHIQAALPRVGDLVLKYAA